MPSSRSLPIPPSSAVVLTGTGACFSAGLDLKAVPAYSPDELKRMILAINRLCRLIYAFPKPLVTAVDGHAIGGGLVIALTGDYRVVTTRTASSASPKAAPAFPSPPARWKSSRPNCAPTSPVASR
jgi:enoyl-CoA hydratase